MTKKQQTKKYRPILFREIKKYCVDVEGGNCCDNTRIIGYPCHGGPNQKFHHNKTTKQLISKSSNKCLERNNKKIIQNKCKSTKKSQKWTKKQFRELTQKIPVVVPSK
jgi:hypothetical protein